jgi:quercetin dioxygenase-like cupin family protein
MAYADEKARAKATQLTANFYAEGLEESKRFRHDYKSKFKNLIKASEMPIERSPQGLIKHIIHEKMDTMEMCVDIYMQFIEGGSRSGKHRHLSEEIFYVVEGSGYDLHWDVKFDCKDEFEWSWETEPKKFEWKEGDFVYIPPYVMHQHFNGDAKNEARIIVINSRIVKKMGFDWVEQVENAPGF